MGAPLFNRGLSVPAELALISPGAFASNGGGVTTYIADPYIYKNRNTAVDFATIAALGIDFIRVFVDPGPVLASTAFSATELAYLMESVAFRAANAGLGVVFTIAPDVNASQFNSNALAVSPTLKTALSSLHQTIVTAFKNDGVPARVAIELWNEPQYYGAEATYLTDITTMYTNARNIDAARPLVIGPCHGMDPGGLQYLTPTTAMKSDANLLFTVHRYGKNNPANSGYPSYAFAYQGLSYGTDWIAGMRTPLKWHPTVGLNSGQIAAARAAAIAAAQATAPAGSNLTTIATEIGSYFDTPASVDVLTGRGELGQFPIWGAANGISVERMFLGEFGCFRYRDPTQGGVQPADAVDYFHDFSLAAETLGIGWCAFAYDAWDATSLGGSASFSLKAPGYGNALDKYVLGPQGLRLKV